MKIVSRKELLTMPAGTLMADIHEDGSYGELQIFGGKFSENDFLTRTITRPDAHDSIEMWDRQDEMLEKGSSYPINTGYGREGLFDDDAKYLVYEAADIASIIAHIAPAMRALSPEDDD